MVPRRCYFSARSPLSKKPTCQVFSIREDTQLESEWFSRRADPSRDLGFLCFDPSIGVFDAAIRVEQAPEFDRAKVYVPDTVIDLLKPHVSPGADDSDLDPIMLPADAAVEAHVAHLEVAGIVRGGSFEGTDGAPG